MLPSISIREVLLACLPSHSWNLSSFTVESIFSFLYFRSKLPLSPRCGSRSPCLSPTLRSNVLDRWLCSFWQGRHSVPANCPLFPFQQAQYAQVFPLKTAPFCTLFAGAAALTSLSLLFSSYLILALPSPPCPLLHLSIYLNFSGKSGRSCLLSAPVLSGYNGSPDTSFSRGTTRLISWPDGERYTSVLQSLVISLVLSLVSTLLFSRTGSVLSHRNSLTHRFPWFPPRNLCSLVTLAVFSFVFDATNTTFC